MSTDHDNSTWTVIGDELSDAAVAALAALLLALGEPKEDET